MNVNVAMADTGTCNSYDDLCAARSGHRLFDALERLADCMKRASGQLRSVFRAQIDLPSGNFCEMRLDMVAVRVRGGETETSDGTKSLVPGRQAPKKPRPRKIESPTDINQEKRHQYGLLLIHLTG